MSEAPPRLNLDSVRQRMAQVDACTQSGSVEEVCGLVIVARGPNAAIGDLCTLANRQGEDQVLAEVVGFRGNLMLLMPLGDMRFVGPGCAVTPALHASAIPIGHGLLGRVVDALGNAMDDGPALEYAFDLPLRRPPPHPLMRKPIDTPFITGVRAIDCFTPIGRGQRMGLFAGSGVGKSTLLGMLVRGAESDINVIALIGERGREVSEFIHNNLDAESRARSVIIVSTSDQPAMVRTRGAFMGTAIAEWFRDQGCHVLFLMDSVTRFAMAKREIGLSVGEPPATRGYPPSVFGMLPRLLERTGNSEKGSITAFYSVLVEGDDMNEPVADCVRGILDGHIVLSRAIATANRFPAVDVLESVSRLSTAICTTDELEIIARARDLLAVYRRNEDLITIGAYARNSNAKVDEAIEKRERIEGFLRQAVGERANRLEAFQKLQEVLQ